MRCRRDLRYKPLGLGSVMTVEHLGRTWFGVQSAEVVFGISGFK